MQETSEPYAVFPLSLNSKTLTFCSSSRSWEEREANGTAVARALIGTSLSISGEAAPSAPVAAAPRERTPWRRALPGP